MKRITSHVDTLAVALIGAVSLYYAFAAIVSLAKVGA